jgi:cob(I)alamin adenosyltransferase
MEEANVAAGLGLLSLKEILEIMAEKPKEVELVITGRGADSKIIEKADLVTEMKEVKHYFQKGVKARIGIEK